MMRKILLAGTAIALLAGCAKSSDLEKVAGTVNRMHLQSMVDEMYPNGITVVRPGDGGYSIAKYDLGTLLVQIEKVEPYADGSRVTLLFGNPLAVSVDGLSASLDWGSTDASGNIESTGMRSKKIKVAQRLLTGAWTRVPLNLEGVPPSALGFVRLTEVDHAGVPLRRPFDQQAAADVAEAAATAAEAAAEAAEAAARR